MWIIRNNKLNIYYKSTINKKMKHFVVYIDEAKKMTKFEANKILLNFNKKENFELMEVKK